MTKMPLLVSNFALKSAGALAVSAAGVRSFDARLAAGAAWPAVSAGASARSADKAATEDHTAAKMDERRITISLRNIQRAFTGENRLSTDLYRSDLAVFDA